MGAVLLCCSGVGQESREPMTLVVTGSNGYRILLLHLHHAQVSKLLPDQRLLFTETKMPDDEKWIEIPILLNYHDYEGILKLFIQFGIKYQSETVTTHASRWRGAHKFSVYVTESQVTAAVLVLRNYIGIEDPASDQPFSGDCPACGERIDSVWTCPSCEISFRSRYEEDDLIVVFIKKYGGFNDP